MPGVPIQCSMVSIVVLRGSGPATRMLLLRRASRYLDGAWSCVAGHVEAGETGAQAAWRELVEETGLLPAGFWATSYCEQFYDPANACIQLVPAFVAQVAEDVAVRLNGEHSAFRWARLDEAAVMVPFGSQRRLIAELRREFIERVPHPALRLGRA